MDERDNGQVRLVPSGETEELMLTIENAIEDRVRTYRRLLRVKQVLAQAKSDSAKK